MLTVAACCLLSFTTNAPAADVAVVCPAVFRSALEPWVEYRRMQGHVVRFIAAERPAGEIKAELRAAHAARPELSVLLVGDAEPAAAHDADVAARSVPTFHAPARVNVLFGSEPQIATDNGYVDFDDDGVPDAAIGRLPVDTPEELSRLVARILAYERSTDFSLWRRRINFVAGVGGFGPVADMALENAAKTLLTRHLPAYLETTMTYAGPASPYYPGSASFQAAALNRFNEGCLMWVYIGHGARRCVDVIYNPDGAASILAAEDVVGLKAVRHPPLACFLSCYSGAYDGDDDCLAEEMLRIDGGPIGVLCGSRVTMPYAMSILSQELMTGFFQRRSPTLGRVFCDGKRNAILGSRNDVESRQFDAAATMLMPMAADLDAQRREHAHLFNLLGDPLLRLPHPHEAVIGAREQIAPGELLVVHGSTPLAGRAVVELVVRRDRLTFLQPDRNPFDRTPTAVAERRATYDRANDPRLASVAATLPAGLFELQLTVPPHAAGECHVRIYVEGESGYAVGATNVKVVPPPRTAARSGP